MAQTRRNYSAEQKVAILRRHFLDKTPVSTLCDDYGIHPTMFYRWQKIFFENGAAAFSHDNGVETRAFEKKVTALESKLAHKDEVIAEIMEDHIRLKKELGEA